APIVHHSKFGGQCPLWVRSGGSATSGTLAQCPLYLQERPNIGTAAKRRFVPKADVSRCSNVRLQKPDLLDHVLAAAEQRWWHFKTERLGRLEIDEQLDFCGLLDR